MEVTVQYLEGCPGRAPAVLAVRDAAAAAGLVVNLVEQRVASHEEAVELGFRGSPTVLVEGRDPFDDGGAPGFACRVYRTEEGLRGVPPADGILAALRAWSTRAQADE
ncbi:MAG: hypothetical protein IE926_01295 [Micrococcales bacterium]|nr:hypothetical protein [Micrococcales bacterium]